MATRDWVERLRPPMPPMLALPQCRGLAPDERLVVAAIREIAANGLDAPAAGAAFEKHCGPAGRDAIEGLRAWLTLLGETAARSILVASRLHCCPSPDEIALLAVIDAARRGDFACAHRLLEGVVMTGAIDAVTHAAEVLGNAFDVATLRLTPRCLGGH